MNKKSIKELKFSAREDRDAAYTLGRHYYLEKKKYRKAVSWFRLAAEQGSSDAQCFLGYCYAEGDRKSTRLNSSHS